MQDKTAAMFIPNKHSASMNIRVLFDIKYC